MHELLLKSIRASIWDTSRYMQLLGAVHAIVEHENTDYCNILPPQVVAPCAGL